MPIAKNRFERAVQVLRWLKSEFPLARVKRLEWVDDLRDEDGDELCGRVVERGRDLVILLSRRSCPTTQSTVETVIHEAAHAHAELWDEGLGFYHGDAFWIRYGRMQDAYEHHGWSDSRAFKGN